MLIVFLRALILYAVVFIVIRLMGKKELSKVQPFELAIIILISDLASSPMSSRGVSIFDGIVPIITLLVACVFFFGWSNLSGILIPGGELVWSSTEDTSYKQLIGRVFKTVTFAINIAAVVAIVFVGVKYIFAGASGRAELKGKSALFIVGIILSFCAVSVLTLLSDVINEFLTN